MKRRKSISKLLAVFMAFCIAFTGMSPALLQTASAADNGNAGTKADAEAPNSKTSEGGVIR